MATTFKEFCRHYGLNPGTNGARRDYDAYLFNLRVLQRIADRAEPDIEPAESLPLPVSPAGESKHLPL